MKQFGIFLFSFFAVTIVTAQTATPKKSSAPAAPAQQRGVAVPKNISPTTFESQIVNGKLTLIKTVTRDANGNPQTPTYSVTCYDDPKFLNNGKALEIRLTQLSFETLFSSNSTLSAKKQDLAKFVQQNNINLTDEKGWITTIKHFNSFY
jgi:hypothetical protein